MGADYQPAVTQTRTHSHAEAAANAIIGAAIAQFVLWAFGVTLALALGLNLTLIAASYARAFVIRRLFCKINRR